MKGIVFLVIFFLVFLAVFTTLVTLVSAYNLTNCPDKYQCPDKKIDYCKIVVTETEYGPIPNCECKTNITHYCDNECKYGIDCYDGDPFTKDICHNFVCKNPEITGCKSDGLCPEGCYYAIDNDCGQCTFDEDCDDNNACTEDICVGNPKQCQYHISEGCNAWTECIPNYNTYKILNDSYYCNNSKPLKQKANDFPCTEFYECIEMKCDNNVCNFCDGCRKGKACVPKESRFNYDYCDVDKTVRSQREKDDSCTANFECLSNFCQNSICQEKGFFSWLKRFFTNIF